MRSTISRPAARAAFRIAAIRVRYLGIMTGLLAEALRRMESLSREEQDAIACQIMETLDDEEAWARRLRNKSAARKSQVAGLHERHSASRNPGS